VQKIQNKAVIREKLCKTHSYEKAAHEMLMKMRPGINFINVLITAFTLVDPKGVKNTVKS
jgi:hypothetical protein